MQGRAQVDMWTANHKIASKFFGMAVDQENGYLLGNGVTFNDAETKDKLGNAKYPFDQQIMRLGEAALIGGVAFGYWAFDHIETFDVTEFVPLYDEENGALSAGIRFWQVDSSKPLRASLYEPDGVTEYIRRTGEEIEILAPKRSYIQIVKSSDVDGAFIYDGMNYPSFPVIPLRNNRDNLSELCGRRNTIDALDLASSNMVNNVDEGNLIYWVLKNFQGMDDLDDANFIRNLKTTHVVHVDGSDSSEATAQTIEAPFNGTQTAIDMLTKRLYEDFQAFDSSAVSAGNQTATAIRASYAPLDLKVDKFERQVTEFINSLLALLGIDDEPAYTRNQIINKSEEVQTILTGAQYLTEDYITRKILTILGDGDLADEIIGQMQGEELDRFNGETETDADEDMAGETEEDLDADAIAAEIDGGELQNFGEDVLAKLEELLDGMNDGKDGE